MISKYFEPVFHFVVPIICFSVGYFMVFSYPSSLAGGIELIF